jgi:hypothetical protein
MFYRVLRISSVPPSSCSFPNTFPKPFLRLLFIALLREGRVVVCLSTRQSFLQFNCVQLWTSECCGSSEVHTGCQCKTELLCYIYQIFIFVITFRRNLLPSFSGQSRIADLKMTIASSPQNISTYVPNDTASYPKILEYLTLVCSTLS